MNTTHAFLIQCITNLHAGSGDANYGIVDKLVQRDTVYNYPTIHASSLKGAIRQHFEDAKYEDVNIIELFGTKSANDDDTESGHCNFVNADLFALPVRCSHKQFALTHCPQSIDFVNAKSDLLIGMQVLTQPANLDKLYTNDSVTEIYLEDDTLTKEVFSPLLKLKVEKFTALNSQFAYVDDKKFDNYAKDLPVIARNRLDKNKNLWYEEVVPHQTIFITYMISNDPNFIAFESHLLNDTIQIGANSSVGYGLCKFFKIEISPKTETK